MQSNVENYMGVRLPPLLYYFFWLISILPIEYFQCRKIAWEVYLDK